MSVTPLQATFFALATAATLVPSSPVLAYGEPVDGFPSWRERVILVWTNRARADPAADLASCEACAERACYAPAAPLTYTRELGRAARFHAAALLDYGGGGYIAHDSLCDLVDDISAQYTPGPCGGQAACACQGGVTGCSGACERFDARVRRFGGFPTAENIAISSAPLSAFYAWLYERWDDPACGRGRDPATRLTNGHRDSILNGGPSHGVGYAGSVLVQDFGYGEAPSGIVAGVHHPESGASVEMRANWYAPAGPARASVNVDGTCQPLALERGTVENGTFLAEVALGAGCHRYYFELDDASGTTHSFPTTGSFGIGCGDDWSEARPPRCGCAPACDGRSCGDDGCGGSCGTCGEDRTCVDGQCTLTSGGTDGGGLVPEDGGVVVARDGGTPEDGGALEDAARIEPRDAGGASRVLVGSCGVAPGGSSPRALLLLIAAASIRAARRRRVAHR